MKAKGIDLAKLDFVVLSHRHSDHMAGLIHVFSVNPKVKIYAPREGFGIYGSSLPSSFYRKSESLPPEMRCYDGKPPPSWCSAPPGRAPTSSRSIRPPKWPPASGRLARLRRARHQGAAGARTRHRHAGRNRSAGRFSHPGIEAIVEAAAKINEKIHLIVSSFPSWYRRRRHQQGHHVASRHLESVVHRPRPLHWRAHVRSAPAGVRKPLSLRRGGHGATTRGRCVSPRLRGEAAALAGEDLETSDKFAQSRRWLYSLRRFPGFVKW